MSFATFESVRPYSHLSGNELSYQMACNRREQQQHTGAMLARLRDDYKAMLIEVKSR